MMKSPDELSVKLARQWQNPDTREERLLKPEIWPLQLKIGKPGGKELIENLGHVLEHVNQWRSVRVGTVHFESVHFRSAGEPVDIPMVWQLSNPTEWVKATGSNEIRREYDQLHKLVAASNPIFRPFLVRQRHLVWNKPEEDVIKATELAMLLEPECARGVPLRAFSIAGIDSKFFERNRTLITKLLDLRFQNQVSDLGLEAFLDALDENAHWLLIADLDGTLLSFSQQRVRASELANTPLPGSRILIVENEKCLHQLPDLPDTVAILGAGLNLSWLIAPWLYKKIVAYWGDIDTWGFVMLARARQHQPDLTALLMTEAVFDRYGQDKAVQEPQPAGETSPIGLTHKESQLYYRIRSLKKGRLEQEFIGADKVTQAIQEWVVMT